MRTIVTAGTLMLACVSCLLPQPAEAYWYGGYYGYPVRPYYWPPPVYYVPYQAPQVVFVPPPVYAAPPVAQRTFKPIRRSRAIPARDACRVPQRDSASPFAGAGERVTPAAAASDAAPLLGPLPGGPRPAGR